MTNVHLENNRISKQFLIIIWIEYALIYMTKNCFNAAMAGIVYEGVLTKSQTGLISTVFYLIYAPLQIVGGVFADRYDPAKLIKIGLVSSGILNTLLFFFHDYASMLVLWGLNGFAQFAVWPAIIKIITSQLTPSDQKSGAFYIAFSSIGGLLLSYMTAALITKWEYNFLISGLIMFGLAVLWIGECHHVAHYMIRDTNEKSNITQVQAKTSGKIFWKSGFYFIVFYILFRTLVDQAVKAFSPTMLTEIYTGVTPSVGNSLNVLIIGATLIGAVIIRKVYPKLIRSEAAGMLMITLAALPFGAVLLFAGKVHLAVTVIALCGIACFLNCGMVLVNCCTVHFTKYGKSATAAGVVNAVASTAFVFVNYGIALIADLFGWTAVLRVLFVFLLIAVILILFAVPLWKRFLNSNQKEREG